MAGIGIGLALGKRIPVIYSITPFLLFRPAEWIRNYIDYEKIPVKLVGSGKDKDYSHDGISHWSTDCNDYISLFKSINLYQPNSIYELERDFENIIYNSSPTYLNLTTRQVE